MRARLDGQCPRRGPGQDDAGILSAGCEGLVVKEYATVSRVGSSGLGRGKAGCTAPVGGFWGQAACDGAKLGDGDEIFCFYVGNFVIFF